MAPDRIETERLTLRRFTLDDAAPYAAIRADPHVCALLGTTPESADERTRWFLAENDRSWGERGFGAYAVEEQTTRALIGHVGLWYLEPFDAVEILYAYARTAWGRGLATEAGRAMVQLAFDELALPRLIALISATNARSLRVAAKLGFRSLGDARHRGQLLGLHELCATGRPEMR